MSRFEATTAHWRMCIPNITFGIGSTLMDLDQLDAIQKPLMHAILPKMGYSSKTCRHVLSGPRTYLGIGARDLVTDRRVQQTLMFVKHIRSNQELSKLLHIGLKWFQLHAGITRPILECCPSIDHPYLEVGWFRTLRKFISFINAEIHIDNLQVPQPLRTNDHTLMESSLDTHNFSGTEWTCIDSTSAASTSE